MGVNAEDIVVCLCRILEFSIKTSHRFVQKHPFVSGSFFLSLLVYAFLPFILSFLAYSSPFLVCIGILLRVFWTSEQSSVVKGDEERNNVTLHKRSGSVEYGIVVNRNYYSSLQNQTSVQRNVKEKNKELDVQRGKMEEDKVLQAASNEYPIGKTAIEEKESYSFEHGESSSANDSKSRGIQNLDEHYSAFLDSARSHKFDVGGIELEADNTEEEDDDDEEEAHEDGNQAVEWTEDDQRNLMDLGISEIERNRRLESLIAKRRAKKLRRMQVERASIDLDSNPPSQVAPIFVARNNPIGVPNILDEIERLEMPDSAPSILLPTRNPFDIPYDPLEEKPNLMGDSFDQEFMSAHKEMLYCRHESFSLGPSFPVETKQDRRDTKLSPLLVTEKGALEGPGYSRFKRHSNFGDHDKLIEQLLNKEGGHRISHVDNIRDLVETATLAHNQAINLLGIEHEEDIVTKNNMIDIKGDKEMETSHGMESILSNKREVDIETDLIEDSSDESNSFSSDEDHEHIINAYRAEVSENVESNPAEMSIRSSIAEPGSEPSYDSSPSADDKNRREDCNFFTGKGFGHTPANSIASDMEVEVSEVGSSPRTVDGTISPIDGESMTFDENTEGSEEIIWAGASSHHSGVEENESRSRGIYAVSGEDIVEVGLSEVNKISKDVVVSSKHPKQIDDQELTDNSSLSSSTVDISGEGQAQSVNIERKIHADVQQVVEKVGEPKSKSSNSSNPSSTENLKREMHLMENLVAHSLNEVESEKPEDLHEMSRKGVNAVHDVNHIVPQPMADMEESKMNESTDGGWQLVNKQDTEKPIEDQALLDSAKPIDGNNNSKPIEDVGGNQVKLTEDEGIVNMAKPIEDKDNLKSILESGDEQSVIARGASGVNRNCNDPIASAAPHELVTEQVPINSSSSSSSKSVSAEKIPIDQASSSNSSQISENTEEANALDKQPPLTLTPTELQNAQHMAEDTTAHPTKNIDFENYLEPSSHSEKLTEGIISVDSLREHMANESKDNLKLIQERVDEQSIIASGASGVNRYSNDPIASTFPRGFVIEEVPINSSSSSSPKSILSENISIDQASSSNSSHNLENNAKADTLEEQPLLNLTLTATQNAQHVVNDTNAHPSKNHGFENSLEASSPSEKSAEETNNVVSLRDPVLNEVKSNLTSFQESIDEQNIIASGASEVNQNSDDHIASASSQELVIEEVPINSSSSSSPKSILPEKIPIDQASSSNSSHNLENNAKANTLEEQPLLNLTLTATQNAQHVVNNTNAHPSKNHGFENLLESSSPSEKSAEETNSVNSLKEHEVNEVKSNLTSFQESIDEQNIMASGTSGVNQNSDDHIASASSHELVIEEVPINSSSSSSPKSILPEKIPIDQASSSNSSQNLENTVKTDTLDEQSLLNLTLSAFQNAQHIVEDTHAHPTKNHSFENLLEPSSPSEKSAEETNSVDSWREPVVNEVKSNLKSIQESVNEQSIMASEASGVNQNSDDHIASASSQELVIEEVPINSSSSSSPKSELPKKIPIDQAFSLNSSQNLENTAQTDTLDEQLLLNFTLAAPQKAQHIVEDTHAHPTNDHGFENLLGPTIPTKKSTGETNNVDNLREPMVNEKEGKKNSKYYQAIEGESKASIGLSKLVHDNNSIPGTMEPGKFTTEANTVYNVSDPVVSDLVVSDMDGYLDVSVNIKEEEQEPSNHLQVKSAPES